MKSAMLLYLFAVIVCVLSDRRRCERVVCYFVIDQVVTMTAGMVSSDICSHIIISPYRMTKNYDLNYLVTWDKPEPIEIITRLKEKSDVKILLGIQNDEFFDGFVAMYRSKSARDQFIGKLVRLLRLKKLDGVKIEEQLHPGGDKEGFSKFIAAIAKRFRKKKLILSVGIPTNVSFIEEYYDLPSLSEKADMLDVSSYHFKVPTSPVFPEHHSPLRSPNASNTKTIDYIMNYVASTNISKEILNVGLSTMNFVYRNLSSKNFELVEITNSFEHCRRRGPYVHSIIHPESVLVVEYPFDNGAREIAMLDEEQTITEKVKYSLSNGYGGVVVKAINYDGQDEERCSPTHFPLITAIKKVCGMT